jgi:hypothetical protein
MPAPRGLSFSLLLLRSFPYSLCFYFRSFLGSVFLDIALRLLRIDVLRTNNNALFIDIPHAEDPAAAPTQ